MELFNILVAILKMIFSIKNTFCEVQVPKVSMNLKNLF